MFKIIIIGSGNVATHLIKAFSNNETADFIQVFTRKKENLYPFIASEKIIDNLSDLKEADLYIIAVSDDAIKIFTIKFPLKAGLLFTLLGVLIQNLFHRKIEKVFFILCKHFQKIIK